MSLQWLLFKCILVYANVGGFQSAPFHFQSVLNANFLASKILFLFLRALKGFRIRSEFNAFGVWFEALRLRLYVFPFPKLEVIHLQWKAAESLILFPLQSYCTHFTAKATAIKNQWPNWKYVPYFMQPPAKPKIMLIIELVAFYYTHSLFLSPTLLPKNSLKAGLYTFNLIFEDNKHYST